MNDASLPTKHNDPTVDSDASIEGSETTSSTTNTEKAKIKDTEDNINQAENTDKESVPFNQERAKSALTDPAPNEAAVDNQDATNNGLVDADSADDTTQPDAHHPPIDEDDPVQQAAATSEISITTTSEDEVVATVKNSNTSDTSDTATNSLSTESTENSIAASDAVRNPHNQPQIDHETESVAPDHNSEPDNLPSDNGKSSEPAQQTSSQPIGSRCETETKKSPAHQVAGHTSSDKKPARSSEPTVEKTEEEESKEERESQLESYKQFVARQENDREIDYTKVRVTIEANALPSKMYFLMNALSAIIASYGLVANSAAVVIGAMLVAMMLGPITGVALAIIDYRMPLLRKSLFTVGAGGALVILIGFVVGLLHHGQPLSNEILSRTQPTSMDLMIALAGGTAGAYAMISPHLSVAVVGVAVATALVPPLAASGILLANGELSLGLGAFLLAVTNIIAIQFTNAMVLWFSGFRRLVDDDYKSSTYLTFFRRNAVTLIMLVVLGIYLSFNLNSIAKQQKFETNVQAIINDHFVDKGNVLTNTQFEKHEDYQTIRAVVRGETDPSPYDVQQIEAAIMKDINENFPKYLPVKVQLRYLPIQVIESNPLTKEKLDETDAAILSN